MSGTKITLKPLFLYEFNNNNDNNSNNNKIQRTGPQALFNIMSHPSPGSRARAEKQTSRAMPAAG